MGRKKKEQVQQPTQEPPTPQTQTPQEPIEQPIEKPKMTQDVNPALTPKALTPEMLEFFRLYGKIGSEKSKKMMEARKEEMAKITQERREKAAEQKGELQTLERQILTKKEEKEKKKKEREQKKLEDYEKTKEKLKKTIQELEEESEEDEPLVSEYVAKISQVKPRAIIKKVIPPPVQVTMPYVMNQQPKPVVQMTRADILKSFGF